MKWSAERTFADVEREMESVEKEYGAAARGGAAIAPPGVSADAAQKAQDPEFRKRMKSMSREEKMKMAMEMMKSAPVGRPIEETDPPLVVEALKELHRVNLGTQKSFEEDVAAEKEAARIGEELARAHAKIDAWEEEEAGKLPQISTGEMSVPDPVQLKGLRLKACDLHIKEANDNLARLKGIWRPTLERTKLRYGAFHRKLAAAEYAVGSKNFGTLKTLSDCQMGLLKGIESLSRHSRNAYEEAGRWMARRRAIERQ